MSQAPSYSVTEDASPAAVSQDGRWERRFPADPGCLSEIRAGVRRFARAHGAPDSLLPDIALAVTEAATNAVLHAFVDREPGEVYVTAEPMKDALLVRVVDNGRGMQPRADSPGMGIGLPTIGMLTTGFDVRQGPGGCGTEVRLVFASPGMRGPARAGGLPGDRVELLAAVTRLAEGGGWPRRGVERLVDLLVPELADACTVDVVDDDGIADRLAARVADPDGGRRTSWLNAKRAPIGRPGTATYAVVRDGRTAVRECTPAEEPPPFEQWDESSLSDVLGIRWWVSVPLSDGERILGLLGLGLRGHRRQPDADDVGLFELVAERAARGLANSALVEGLRHTRQRMERILGALAEAITVSDQEGRVVYANEAAARLLGASDVEEVLAADPADLAGRFIITREDGSPVAMEDLPNFRLVNGLDAPPLVTRSVHRESGRARWLLTKATMLDDEGLVVNIIEDVTEAKDAERRQRLLAEASEVLASSLDYEQTLEHVARLAVPELADWCGVDLVDDDGELRRLALAHVDPEKEAFGRELGERYPPDTSGERGVGGILRGGDAELYPQIPDELLAQRARDEEHLRLLREVGMRSAMLLPIRVGERTMGAMTLVSAESRRAFTEQDLEVARQLARRAAVAIDNARRFRELGG